MIVRIAILLHILLGMTTSSLAQKTGEDDYASGRPSSEMTEPRQHWTDRIVFGGNLGGNIGAESFFQLNPMIGYRTTQNWINGVSLNYIYYTSGSYRENIYGAGLWSRATIFRGLFAHSEFEMMRRNGLDRYGNSFNATVPIWLVGGGYNSGGSRLGVSAMIMYDLIQDPNSPYGQPVIRIGGLFGF